MAIQQVLNNFELLAILLQTHVKNMAIERAYIIADMAVRGEYPDERFSDKECELWNKYRFEVEWWKNKHLREES